VTDHRYIQAKKSKKEKYDVGGWIPEFSFEKHSDRDKESEKSNDPE